MADKTDKEALKAAKKAEKERRKNSTDPADMGRLKQIWMAYKLTAEYDKALPLLMLAAFGVPLVLAIVLAIVWKQPVFGTIMTIILGLTLGLLLALLLLTNRTKKATYARYKGQIGSAEVALQMLSKKWMHTPAIAATQHKDVVHRAVGPGGIVLVGEGDPGRVRKMLQQEQKKHEKFVSNVLVSTFACGDAEGQVPLEKLQKAVEKLPKTLEPYQVTDVENRLKAIDAVRPKLPMPKGPMPTSMKGARRSMRGR